MGIEVFHLEAFLRANLHAISARDAFKPVYVPGLGIPVNSYGGGGAFVAAKPAEYA